jgi:hypothetical protein
LNLEVHSKENYTEEVGFLCPSIIPKDVVYKRPDVFEEAPGLAHESDKARSRKPMGTLEKSKHLLKEALVVSHHHLALYL